MATMQERNLEHVLGSCIIDKALSHFLCRHVGYVGIFK